MNQKHNNKLNYFKYDLFSLNINQITLKHINLIKQKYQQSIEHNILIKCKMLKILVYKS